jgi:hypothetical protein
MNIYQQNSSRLVAVFLVIPLFFVFGLEMYACTCAGRPSVKKSIQTQDIIVTGKIIAKQDYYDLELVCYTVLVSRDFKHTAPGDTIYVYSGQGDGNCGIGFILEREYIIYASGAPYLDKYWLDERVGRIGREYVTNICTRTQTKNDEEIAAIEKEL